MQILKAIKCECERKWGNEIYREFSFFSLMVHEDCSLLLLQCLDREKITYSYRNEVHDEF